ncbi:hypothetical protein C8Q78DRAFT_1090586 [Trametes maxima]|nr:hypothetical protein C8Q78DRAFT_1090586 [Trametes maxima]
MRSLRLDLPLLLWSMSYNVPELVEDQLVKFERTALLSSSELPSLLRAWHKPPRSHGRGIKSKGGSRAIDVFALERVVSTVRREMVDIGVYMRTEPSDLSADNLLSIKISDMKAAVKACAPTLWSLLRQCSWTSRQAKRNTMKDPDTVFLTVIQTILYTISMMSFCRSNRNSPLQRLMAIYLRSCGTSAKAFDTLSAVGLTMSQAWTYQAIEQLSHSEHKSMLKDLEVYPWFGSHDNVNFRFRVFEQRSDHHSHFDSGTAGTIFVVKDPNVVPPSAETLRNHRDPALPHPLISASLVLSLEADAAPRLATRAKDVILQLLLGTPAFDLGSYEFRDSLLLKPAPRPGQLHVGAEMCIRQYILDTVHIEEASYDGNSRVLCEWLRQLKLNTPEEQRRTGEERVLPWVGDQLTASRLRGLQQFRRDDCNSFERLDWLVPTFGWFHLMFAFEQSLHTEYYGTRTSLGLLHAFEVLDRRGLHTTSTQGTFHHTFEEGLDHCFQAHIRALWCHVAGVEKLEDLRSRTPEELCSLSARILCGHASTMALSSLSTNQSGLPTKILDQHHYQITQFIRDVLDYIILRDAIACGDVQTMEDSLPRLLFRFSGGQNPNYTTEVCELLQNLHYDWPADLRQRLHAQILLGYQHKWAPKLLDSTRPCKGAQYLQS